MNMGDRAMEEPVAGFSWSQRIFSKTHAGMDFSQNRHSGFPLPGGGREPPLPGRPLPPVKLGRKFDAPTPPPPGKKFSPVTFLRGALFLINFSIFKKKKSFRLYVQIFNSIPSFFRVFVLELNVRIFCLRWIFSAWKFFIVLISKCDYINL